VKSVGGAQRRLRQAQEEVLRPTVNIPRQLDAVVQTLVEAPEDGVLKASRSLPRERPLTRTMGERGDNLGHGQIGHEDIVPAPYGRRSATRIPADGAESGVMVASAPSVSIAA